MQTPRFAHTPPAAAAQRLLSSGVAEHSRLDSRRQQRSHECTALQPKAQQARRSLEGVRREQAARARQADQRGGPHAAHDINERLALYGRGQHERCVC